MNHEGRAESRFYGGGHGDGVAICIHNGDVRGAGRVLGGVFSPERADWVSSKRNAGITREGGRIRCEGFFGADAQIGRIDQVF